MAQRVGIWREFHVRTPRGGSSLWVEDTPAAAVARDAFFGDRELLVAQVVPAFGQTASVDSGVAAARNLSAGQNVPAFTQGATAQVWVQASAGHGIASFTQSTAVQVWLQAAAAQQVPAFARTQTLAGLASAQAAQSIAAFNQSSGAQVWAQLAAAQQVPAFGQSGAIEGATARLISATQAVPAFGQLVGVQALLAATVNQIVLPFAQVAALNDGSAPKTLDFEFYRRSYQRVTAGAAEPAGAYDPQFLRIGERVAALRSRSRSAP
jgi:hypothetical protein